MFILYSLDYRMVKRHHVPVNYLLIVIHLCYRIVWGILCAGAFSFFVWFMSERLRYMLGHPKAVDVEVIYTDTVNFPAVTICNQNLFR